MPLQVWAAEGSMAHHIRPAAAPPLPPPTAAAASHGRRSSGEKPPRSTDMEAVRHGTDSRRGPEDATGRGSATGLRRRALGEAGFLDEAVALSRAPVGRATGPSWTSVGREGQVCSRARAAGRGVGTEAEQLQASRPRGEKPLRASLGAASTRPCLYEFSYAKMQRGRVGELTSSMGEMD